MALAEPAAGSGLEKSATEDLALVSVALARHFAAGATMWCVAPQWPSQGPDMAVEFAYPVTTGSPRGFPPSGFGSRMPRRRCASWHAPATSSSR